MSYSAVVGHAKTPRCSIPRGGDLDLARSASSSHSRCSRCPRRTASCPRSRPREPQAMILPGSDRP
eukprot:3818519-Pyramimonas_sp.AAC.1